MGVPAMNVRHGKSGHQLMTEAREQLVRKAVAAINAKQPAGGYEALGFALLPREVRAAAEAAVDALCPCGSEREPAEAAWGSPTCWGCARK